MRKLQELSLLIAAFILFGFSAIGQGAREKADMQFKLKAYDLSIESYQEYLTNNPDDIVAMGRLAASYERSNDLISAARWYEKVHESPKHLVYQDIMYGKVLMKLGLYDRAKELFSKMKDKSPFIAQQYINSCEFAKNILALGDKYVLSQLRASSAFDDFGVEITNDGIVYCTFNVGKSVNQSLVQRQASKLYKYNKNNNRKEEFKPGMMNMSGIGPIRFSPSGKYVVYTRNSFKNGTQQITGLEKDMSTYIAEVDANGSFVNEQALPFNGVDYSTAFACFGDNDNEIYYSSNKNGKNFDLYKSDKVNGEWSDGVILDKNINTIGNEITPYYTDGTLYFSSDYLNGLGGYDVFKSSVYKGEWSFPMNMGKGINSPADDLYFVIKANQRISYITSNRLGSKGGYDIYSASPASRISDKSISYIDIPEAVNLNSLNESKSTDIGLSAAVTVSNTGNYDMASFDGAKMVSYDEVILSPSTVYFIQLASLSHSRVRGNKFKKLTKYGNVYKVRKGRLTKIRLGYFVSESEAKAVLSSVKRKGFRDAFIVEDLLNSSELELLESSYTFNNNKKYSLPAEIGDYKVKLAAYTNPLYFDVNKVKDLGVIEQWSKGKWTIFILSGYTDLSDAEAAMRKARNRGYTTAEVVLDEGGVLSRVKNN